MNRLFFALGLIALTGCRCEEVDLVEHCPVGNACYVRYDEEVVINPQGFVVGECRYGEVVGCNELGALCAGSVGAIPETCNNLDDDCDGVADEGLRRGFSDLANTCPRVGSCAFPTQFCDNGIWFCDYPFGPDPEVCNGADDDCDGESDEGLDAEVFFYPSDDFPDTVGVGACRPGVSTCSAGRLREAEAVTPIEEVVCNGIDDDCDGIVDEDETDTSTRAFVILLDRSGSMESRRSMLEAAICSWSTNSLSESTSFAVIYFGLGLESSGFVTVAQDFGTAEQACSTLYGQFTGGSYGPEYALEALSIGDLLEWPAGADRHQLVFTDEPIQRPSYVGSISMQQIEADCSSSPYEVGVFTDWTSEWAPLIDVCGGFVEYFAETAGEMEERLHQRFAGNTCAP